MDLHSSTKKKKIFYVNPMGYGSLANYDYFLMSQIPNTDINYFTNAKFALDKFVIPYSKIYSYSDKKGIVKILSYLKSQWLLIKQIKKKSPDLIHFQWLKIPYLDYLFLKYLKKRNLKLVLTAHNILPHNTGNKYLKSYKNIYKAVDAIIVHAETTKIEMISMFPINPLKIHVIPHGILKMETGAKEDIEELKKEFTNKLNLNGKIVFSILGGFHKYKGSELVIDAWQQLKLSKNSKLHLLIAGRGKLDAIEKLSTDTNASIINRFLSNDEFIALLQISDFILLPYLIISQSGVLLTALNEKKKIIVSNKGGLTEPFQFGEIGYILEEVTIENLVEVFLKAAKEKNNVVGEDIWQAIFNHYDWKNIGVKTKQLYDSLI